MKTAFLGVALLLCTSQVVLADPVPVGPMSFSADFTVHTHGQDMSGKFWIDGGKTRFDAQAKGRNVSDIIRPDRQVSYMVMVDQHMYMELPLNAGAGPSSGFGASTGPSVASGRPDAVLADLGPDTINGQACEKYSVSVKGKVESYEWRAKGQLVPVRVASADGESVTDFTNVHSGPQDPGVFEPPAGFQKMSMPGMPGGGPPPPP